jgi:TRAP-type C4-dicarboxylate transport system permease small subunit
MAISYFFEKFSITSQIFIKHLSNIIYLGVGIFLAAVSIKSASFSFMLGTMCDTIPVPVGVIYLAFPIAFILMTIFVLLQTVLTIINPRGVLEEENKGCFE